MYDRNIFASSSNVRKFSEKVRVAFGKLLESLRKSSESGRKSSENSISTRTHFYDNTIHLPAAVEAFSAFGLSIVLLIMSFHDLST